MVTEIRPGWGGRWWKSQRALRDRNSPHLKSTTTRPSTMVVTCSGSQP